MKSIPYICLVILGLIILVQNGFVMHDNRAIETQRDSTAYWKGRYDSVVKRFNEEKSEINNIDINMWAEYDFVYARIVTPSFGIIHIDKTETLSLDNIFRWRNNTHPIRHSRHRKDNSHYKHDEEINDKHFPDYLGTDTVPINKAPARMEMLTKSEPFLAPCITIYEFQIFRDTSYSAIVVKMDKDSTVEIMGDTSRIIRNLIFSYWRYVEQESKKTEELRKAKYLLYRMLMLKYYPAMQIKFCKY